MKKFLKYALAAFLVVPMVACSDYDGPGSDELTAEEKAMQKVTENFVNKVVVPTYKSLADETIDLLSDIESLSVSRTQADVNAACESWKKARQWWEWSEAYLFGPATNYGIDPHIDTWPLDRIELDKLLANEAMMENLDAEYAGGYLGAGLLGFHGLEYIIFRNGQPRNVSEITENEIKYAEAVAGDLRNQCLVLEAAWAGMDGISSEKATILTELEMEPAENYGDYMINAGEAGSIFKSKAEAVEEIIEGCITIADEVGLVKIGKPHTGEDINYIESPYAYNSLQDFYDNVVGIEAVYLGGYENNRDNANSPSSFIASKDKDADNAVKAAIENAKAKIQAVPKPFVQHYQDASVEDAMDACADLVDALIVAKAVVTK